MSQLGWQLRVRHIIGAIAVHKHHLAKISSNRHLCVAIRSPSLSWPCLHPNTWGFLWWDSDIVCWGSNGSRRGHSRSRQCVFATASAPVYWAWSPYEEDTGVVLCHARGKCILTPMLGRHGDAHSQLQTAVEAGRMPGLFPEHCSVVTVHVLLRDTGQIVQDSQGTRACSRCELQRQCKQAFCLLYDWVPVHNGVVEHSTQTQGLIMGTGKHTRSLLPRLLS